MRILALDLGAGWRGGQKQTALVAAALRRARTRRRRSLAAAGSPLAREASPRRPRREDPRSRARRGVAAAPLRGRARRPSAASRDPLGLGRARARGRRLEPRGGTNAPRSPPARRLPAGARSALAPEIPGGTPFRRHLRGGRPRPFRSGDSEGADRRRSGWPSGRGVPSRAGAPRAPFPSPSRRGLRRTQGAGRRRRGTRPRRRGGNRRDAHVPRRRTAARRDGTPRRGIRGPFALHLRRRGPGRPRAPRRFAPSSPPLEKRRGVPRPRRGDGRRLRRPRPRPSGAARDLRRRRRGTPRSDARAPRLGGRGLEPPSRRGGTPPPRRRRDAGLPRRGRSPRASSGSKTFSGRFSGPHESPPPGDQLGRGRRHVAPRRQGAPRLVSEGSPRRPRAPLGGRPLPPSSGGRRGSRRGELRRSRRVRGAAAAGSGDPARAGSSGPSSFRPASEQPGRCSRRGSPSGSAGPPRGVRRF